MRRTLLPLVFVVSLGASNPAEASTRPFSVQQAGARRHVTVRMPASTIEGDRFKVRVTLTSAAAAKRVTLERQTVDVLDNKGWETVTSVSAAGQRTHVFKTLVDELGTGKYRARVTYRDAGPATSKPARTTVWRWMPLYTFASYYRTSGIWPLGSSSLAMNGQQYQGWRTYATYPSWEERFTVGRHCRMFRGDLGVQDTSDDGTSATLELASDDFPVFTSQALTPGMVQSVEIAIDRPYRIAIRATNTSPEDVDVLPAIGDPELLCTGV